MKNPLNPTPAQVKYRNRPKNLLKEPSQKSKCRPKKLNVFKDKVSEIFAYNGDLYILNKNKGLDALILNRHYEYLYRFKNGKFDRFVTDMDILRAFGLKYNICHICNKKPFHNKALGPLEKSCIDCHNEYIKTRERAKEEYYFDDSDE